MIKLVIFDLDGVIIDLKECHYEALNDALRLFDKEFAIGLEEHYKFYDGLPTKEKLKMLTKYKKLPINIYDEISQKKQEFTLKYIYDKVSFSQNIFETLEWLKNNKYHTCIASNSVSNTIYAILTKLKILHLIDNVLSNQDVKFAKPNPEIYFKSISKFGVMPKETLIVEDSPYGLEAAYQSGAHVMQVKNSLDVTPQRILNEVQQKSTKIKNYTWKNTHMNVLIPMAGAGSRFELAGYTLPKPLIDVSGKPMIQRVVDNLNIDAKYTFIVQKQHEEKYAVSKFLKSIASCQVIQVDKLTEGAACTALLAKEIINSNEPLLIANSDQFIEWDSTHFYYQMSSARNIDASIITFNSTHPKWSYAKVNGDGLVTEVAEKNPISDIATVGIYYWSRGSDFVKYAESMINKNIRVNNEFYIAPVFNEAIKDNKCITTFNVDKMWGLGTPEDLEYFLKYGNHFVK